MSEDIAGTHGGIDYDQFLSLSVRDGRVRLTPSIPVFVVGSVSSFVSTIIANVASSAHQFILRSVK